MKTFLIFLGAILVTGFSYWVISNTINQQNRIDLQNQQLKQIDVKFKDTKQEKAKIQQELEKINSDNEALKNKNSELDQMNKSLDSKLQAKLKLKAEATLASSKPTVTAQGGDCVDYARQAGITHAGALEIIGRENKQCNPCIYNNGSSTGAVDCNYEGGRAYGIPQSLPGNKMASAGADWRTNPVTQLRWMQSYVYGRYTTWEAAIVHHDQMGWY